MSVALVAGGVVAPTAGAVTTSIKNDKCTITLNEEEASDLKNAESKDNDVDSSLLKNGLKISPKDAEKRARDVENQSDELYRALAGYEAEVELGDEDAVKRAKNNIAVVEASVGLRRTTSRPSTPVRRKKSSIRKRRPVATPPPISIPAALSSSAFPAAWP